MNSWSWLRLLVSTGLVGVDLRELLLILAEIDDDYVGSFLPGQPVLHCDVEEEHTDLLAGNTITELWQSRAFSSAGTVRYRPRPDDEKLFVAHRKHRQAGEVIVEGPRNVGWRRWPTDGFAPQTQDWTDQTRRIFEGEHGGWLRQHFDGTLKEADWECLSPRKMIIWFDLVYRCNDNVPEAVYWELPKRIQEQVEIDASRPCTSTKREEAQMNHQRFPCPGRVAVIKLYPSNNREGDLIMINSRLWYRNRASFLFW